MDSLGSLNSERTSAIKPSIPSPKGNLFRELDELGLPRGLLENRMRLESFPQGLRTILVLLDSLRPKILKRGSTFKDSSIVRQSRAWVLSWYHRLWKPIYRWLRLPNNFDTGCKDYVCSQFLARVRPICVPPYFPSAATDLAHDSIEVLCQVLEMEDLSQLSASQLELKQAIVRLMDLFNHTGSFPVICGRAVVLPTMEDLQKKNNFRQLAPQLQVTLQQ